jgi:hypothetical protein
VFFHQGELAIDIRGKRFAGVEGIAGDVERRRIRRGRREDVDGTILITLRKVISPSLKRHCECGSDIERVPPHIFRSGKFRICV